MPEGSSRRPPDQEGRAWIALAFVLAAGLRFAFAWSFPTIHGGDAAGRLAQPEALVLGYQLPLPQVFVSAGKAIHDDPILVRGIFCAWGGALAAGVTALLARAIGSRAALFGAILLSSDPLLTHYSIVPYQESVAYALLAWAFHFTGAGRPRLGGLLLAAACLSRYEAWLFVPIFWWASRSPLATVIGALPILGWIFWWQGLAPTGLYVLDLDLRANRVSRVVYLAHKFIEYETLSVLLLAFVGGILAAFGHVRIVVMYAFALALVIAVIVGLGHEFPPGSGLVSERLIHLPVLLALSLSAFALARASAASRSALLFCLGLTVLFAGRNIRFERALLTAAAREPDLALARDAARAIEARRGPTECVTVIAPSVDPALLEGYVSKVGAAFGDVDRARTRAQEFAGTSPDRDRIAAHLKAKAGTVRAEPGCPWVLLVDGPDPHAADGPVPPEPAVAEVRAGTRRARLLRNRP